MGWVPIGAFELGRSPSGRTAASQGPQLILTERHHGGASDV